MLLNELNTCNLWWNGPSFLYENGNRWSQTQDQNIMDGIDTLPEIKHSAVNVVCKNDFQHLQVIDFNRFSKLNRLRRACAYMLRFIHNSRVKNSNQRLCGPLSVEELNKSLIFLIRQAQIQSFSEEYKALINNLSLKSRRNISGLNIFLDNDNIIRVGGRLVNSNFSYDVMFLLIFYCEVNI